VQSILNHYDAIESAMAGERLSCLTTSNGVGYVGTGEFSAWLVANTRTRRLGDEDIEQYLPPLWVH
jgi:hypothetical protein